VLLRASVVSAGNAIGVADLPPAVAAPPESDLPPRPVGGDLDGYLSDVERRLVRAALARNGWVQTRAAKELGLHEKVLRYRMKKLGIIRPGDGPDGRRS
jgi:Nif-specific regulatory protein